MKQLNKKGQALVEFIIILPVFIFLILAIVDVGKMFYDKNVMQQELNELITMYDNGSDYNEMQKHLQNVDKNIKLELKNENNEYIEFVLSKKPNITTPGLNLILNKDTEVKRVIYYDE